MFLRLHVGRRPLSHVIVDRDMLRRVLIERPYLAKPDNGDSLTEMELTVRPGSSADTCLGSATGRAAGPVPRRADGRLRDGGGII